MTKLSLTQIDTSLNLFLHWLHENGYTSHDPYSLWSTRFGIRAKAQYQRNPLLGAALVAPIFLADILIPGLTRRSLKKQRFPIADAHCILALCALTQQTSNEYYVPEAESVMTSLMQQSLHESHSGHCWGYPFDWMSKQGLWRSDTPLITSTPYGFEALLALYDITQKSEYMSAAQSVAHFAFNDLQQTVLSDHSVASSYSPIDNSMVINANAYRAMVLTESWRRFGSSRMIDAAKRNINFVIESQQPDGSWWYAMGHDSDRFVDNFHTCLVLKNLIKINRVLGFEELWSVIARGYEFYLRSLIDSHGRPRPFAKSQRIPLVSAEMYDYAEGITLGVLMHRHFPAPLDTHSLSARALKTAENLASTLVHDYQLADGHFVTKEHFGVIRNTTPYIRWPQAQIFYALTQLRSVLAEQSKAVETVSQRGVW